MSTHLNGSSVNQNNGKKSVNESVKECNPFVHRLQLTKAQKCQIFFMTFTIFPVRLVLGLSVFFFSWFLALLFTVGTSPNTSSPAGPVRRALYQFLQYCGKLIIFLIGFSFTVKGKRASVEEAPVLIATPHSSLWDILVLFATSPFPSALSKYENFKIPIFRTLLRAIQPVLVHRNEAMSTQQTVDIILKRAKEGKKWPQLTVFPEGTCSNKKHMIRFKLGAFLAGTPVQPMIIRYKSSLDSFTWTECGPTAFYLIWLTLCQFQSHMEVEYLPVYKPTAEEMKDPKLYANNVRDQLAKKLRVPCSDHTYEDRLLMRKAKKLHFPMEAAIVQFHYVKTKYKLNLDEAMKRLEEFSQISLPRQDGLADADDFNKYFSCNEQIVNALFSELDVYQKGILSFREFVIGNASIREKLASNQNLESCHTLLNKLLATSTDHGGDKHDFGKELLILSQKVCPQLNVDDVAVAKETFFQFLQENPMYLFLFVFYQGK
ncbi:unnamed protein product [Clavelina lepadiformis]|uniref:Phospholipid/glycerol acyltransferase domain-containing protein n=1 Tax=Clavelina lepadiformis TaxID=159417 RepID=A0ABP0FNB6_CLALP